MDVILNPFSQLGVILNSVNQVGVNQAEQLGAPRSGVSGAKDLLLPLKGFSH